MGSRLSRRRRRFEDDDEYDDDDDDDLPEFRCPFCKCKEPPYQRSQISPAGWVVFALGVLLCLPFCWVGLLITESYRVCSYCGTRLG